MRKVTALVMTMIICISLVVSAAASANFVPSITAKPAPEVVVPPAANTGKTESGTEAPEEQSQYQIVIKDEEESVVSSSKTAYLIVTPVSVVMNKQTETQPVETKPGETQPEETLPEETQPELSEERSEALKEAYETLSAKNVVLTEVVDGLEEVVAEQKADASKLVVKDLFDIRLSEEDFEADLEVEGHTIDVAFKADIQKGQTVFVAVFKDGKWIMAKKVIVGEDGIITATLECLGTVAIIVEEQDLLLLPEPEN